MRMPGVFVYKSSDMELAAAFIRIEAARFQSMTPGLHPGPHLVRRMRMANGHDVVAAPSRPTQRFYRSSCYPNRRMRLLHRPRVKSDLLELPKSSLIAKALFRPSSENDLVCFFHTLAGLLS